MFLVERDLLLLDEMTRKLHNKNLVRDAQSLGFLYKGTNSKPTCGVVLVTFLVALTDGSCVPDGTDLSKIYILFRVVEDHTTADIYHVLDRADYKTDHVNILILLVSPFMQTRGFILKSVD